MSNITNELALFIKNKCSYGEIQRFNLEELTDLIKSKKRFFHKLDLNSQVFLELFLELRVYPEVWSHRDKLGLSKYLTAYDVIDRCFVWSEVRSLKDIRPGKIAAYHKFYDINFIPILNELISIKIIYPDE